MAYKDLVVQIDNSEQCASRLEAAVELAKRFDAHLTGLYRIPEIDPRLYMDVGIPLDRLDEQQAQIQETSDAAKASFEQQVTSSGIRAEWRTVEGHFANIIGSGAIYADLVIAGQHNSEDPQSPSLEFTQSLLLNSGRPTLLIPYIGFRGPVGKNILVAWNESRESTRAVHDALPALEAADKVHVLSVAPSSSDAASSTSASVTLAHHLAHHGINAESHHLVGDDIDPGEALLSRASDLGVDMIVMGAYGHSRLREWVMGGVTRTILAEMTVPVMMSH